jgi:CRISPR system Cascade subunit CasE
MYISRVEVDVANRQKTQDLTHLGAYHNWVEQSFPEEIATKTRLRHLWRIDNVNGHEYLLLVSEDKPSIELLGKYGVSDSAQTKSYDELLSDLKVGQSLRFRLTANPTHSLPHTGGARGKRVPHVTVEHQAEWLIKQSKRNGFSVTSDDTATFDIVARDWPTLRKANKQGARMSRVTYEGVLTITDIDLFKASLVNGIGREKAYGMGLMTVIPSAD